MPFAKVVGINTTWKEKFALSAIKDQWLLIMSEKILHTIAVSVMFVVAKEENVRKFQLGINTDIEKSHSANAVASSSSSLNKVLCFT